MKCYDDVIVYFVSCVVSKRCWSAWRARCYPRGLSWEPSLGGIGSGSGWMYSDRVKALSW